MGPYGAGPVNAAGGPGEDGPANWNDAGEFEADALGTGAGAVVLGAAGAGAAYAGAKKKHHVKMEKIVAERSIGDENVFIAGPTETYPSGPTSSGEGPVVAVGSVPAPVDGSDAVKTGALVGAGALLAGAAIASSEQSTKPVVLTEEEVDEVIKTFIQESNSVSPTSQFNYPAFVARAKTDRPDFEFMAVLPAVAAAKQTYTKNAFRTELHNAGCSVTSFTDFKEYLIVLCGKESDSASVLSLFGKTVQKLGPVAFAAGIKRYFERYPVDEEQQPVQKKAFFKGLFGKKPVAEEYTPVKELDAIVLAAPVAAAAATTVYVEETKQQSKLSQAVERGEEPVVVLSGGEPILVAPITEEKEVVEAASVSTGKKHVKITKIVGHAESEVGEEPVVVLSGGEPILVAPPVFSEEVKPVVVAALVPEKAAESSFFGSFWGSSAKKEEVVVVEAVKESTVHKPTLLETVVEAVEEAAVAVETSGVALAAGAVAVGAAVIGATGLTKHDDETSVKEPISQPEVVLVPVEQPVVSAPTNIEAPIVSKDIPAEELVVVETVPVVSASTPSTSTPAAYEPVAPATPVEVPAEQPVALKSTPTPVVSPVVSPTPKKYPFAFWKSKEATAVTAPSPVAVGAPVNTHRKSIIARPVVSETVVKSPVAVNDANVVKETPVIVEAVAAAGAAAVVAEQVSESHKKHVKITKIKETDVIEAPVLSESVTPVVIAADVAADVPVASVPMPDQSKENTKLVNEAVKVEETSWITPAVAIAAVGTAAVAASALSDDESNPHKKHVKITKIKESEATDGPISSGYTVPEEAVVAPSVETEEEVSASHKKHAKITKIKETDTSSYSVPEEVVVIAAAPLEVEGAIPESHKKHVKITKIKETEASSGYSVPEENVAVVNTTPVSEETVPDIPESHKKHVKVTKIKEVEELATDSGAPVESVSPEIVASYPAVKDIDVVNEPADVSATNPIVQAETSALSLPSEESNKTSQTVPIAVVAASAATPAPGPAKKSFWSWGTKEKQPVPPSNVPTPVAATSSQTTIANASAPTPVVTKEVPIIAQQEVLQPTAQPLEETIADEASKTHGTKHFKITKVKEIEGYIVPEAEESVLEEIVPTITVTAPSISSASGSLSEQTYAAKEAPIVEETADESVSWEAAAVRKNVKITLVKEAVVPTVVESTQVVTEEVRPEEEGGASVTALATVAAVAAATVVVSSNESEESAGQSASSSAAKKSIWSGGKKEEIIVPPVPVVAPVVEKPVVVETALETPAQVSETEVVVAATNVESQLGGDNSFTQQKHGKHMKITRVREGDEEVVPTDDLNENTTKISVQQPRELVIPTESVIVAAAPESTASSSPHPRLVKIKRSKVSLLSSSSSRLDSATSPLDNITEEFLEEGDVQIDWLVTQIATESDIVELDLGDDVLAPEDVTAIAQALHVNKTVERLVLGSSGASPDSLKALADSLRQNNTLKQLEFGPGTVADLETEQVFADALLQNNSLIVLNLPFKDETSRLSVVSTLERNSNLPKESLRETQGSSETVVIAARKMPSQSSLKHVKIRRSRPSLVSVDSSVPESISRLEEIREEGDLEEGDVEISWLITQIASDSDIVELDFADDQLAPEDVNAIAQALRVNKSVQRLVLGKSGVTNESLKVLADSLKYNESLTEVAVGEDVEADLETEQAFVDALMQNKKLTRFSMKLKDPLCRDAIVSSLARNAGDSSRITGNEAPAQSKAVDFNVVVVETEEKPDFVENDDEIDVHPVVPEVDSADYEESKTLLLNAAPSGWLYRMIKKLSELSPSFDLSHFTTSLSQIPSSVVFDDALIRQELTNSGASLTDDEFTELMASINEEEPADAHVAFAAISDAANIVGPDTFVSKLLPDILEPSAEELHWIKRIRGAAPGDWWPRFLRKVGVYAPEFKLQRFIAKLGSHPIPMINDDDILRAFADSKARLSSQQFYRVKESIVPGKPLVATSAFRTMADAVRALGIKAVLGGVLPGLGMWVAEKTPVSVSTLKKAGPDGWLQKFIQKVTELSPSFDFALFAANLSSLPDDVQLERTLVIEELKKANVDINDSQLDDVLNDINPESKNDALVAIKALGPAYAQSSSSEAFVRETTAPKTERRSRILRVVAAKKPNEESTIKDITEPPPITVIPSGRLRHSSTKVVAQRRVAAQQTDAVQRMDVAQQIPRACQQKLAADQ
ncbi:hypothetical protein BCR33DRAFT_446748 [Rhizoclosmatium globosum]|uniref:Uncharacterized protein n=1 Tax=Rhizoclosmatium globosum TaxID=329046 RepID=A0A1Y2BS63_9FUNG|nr:hypothetical protein BCR33DRAFT_446748 [Rhizoclosmatium globosum]|eukprot:ORY37564.1 hypothetical protein BCR33DRAFT_446748 [Rhizoclosmatium globosum]